MIPAVPRDGLLPMSFGQQRLWFLEDFTEGGTGYHSAAGLRLTGSLDVEALRAAVGDLVARHEALRTTFDVVDGRGVQIVHPVLQPEWRAEEAAGEERLRALAQEELARPYDLRNGPLVRVLLVRLGAEEHVCVLGMHHIVTDGWSMGAVARELGELYAARTEGREPDPCRRSPSSTRTSPPGSAPGWRTAACWKSSSTGGAPASTASRRWTSPRTGRARLCARRRAACTASTCRRPPWTGSRTWRARRVRPSSWP